VILKAITTAMMFIAIAVSVVGPAGGHNTGTIFFNDSFDFLLEDIKNSCCAFELKQKTKSFMQIVLIKWTWIYYFVYVTRIWPLRKCVVVTMKWISLITDSM